jgi:hypothetical protein
VPFVMELLQSPGNSHANEREPRPNRSRQSKIATRSGVANPFSSKHAIYSNAPGAPFMHRKRLTMRQQSEHSRD